MKRILASVSPGEVRVALLAGDRLEEAWVERPHAPDGVGDLHRARVTAAAPALSGVFCDLGGGLSGFLPEGEAGARRGAAPPEGALLAVRITRAAQGGKGPRLTARVPPADAALAAAGAPRLLARGPEAALRLARAHPAAMVETDGPLLAARLRAALGPGRVRLGPGFDAALEEEFAGLALPEVPLPGGGRILIQPTAALVAIDIDAGPGAPEQVNAPALAEAARQIRLRNLGGAILIDPAGLSVARRAGLEAPLARALGPDPRAKLLGLGPLGLFEVQRQRVHPALHEVLAGPLTPGLAALRRVMREAAARPGAALTLRAAPAVLAALAAVPGLLAEVAALLGRPLALRPDPAVLAEVE